MPSPPQSQSQPPPPPLAGPDQATASGRVSRKRKRGCEIDRRPPATTRLQSADAVKHALLAQYYPKILTLRQYLLHTLPASSRIRRRKIEAFGSERDDDHVRVQLAQLLDTALVGLQACPQEVANARSKSRLQQWIDYSQKDDSHVTLSSGHASAIHAQSEIVDFIIWLSFSRAKPPSNRPHHLLCDGYRKTTRPGQQGALSSIQGVYSLYFNARVAAIKQTPWPQLLLLLGKSGESIMINMLLDCAVFLPVEAGQGNYYQLSGTPIFECETLVSQPTSASPKAPEPFERPPAEILFVRNRMLYARAALNARGLVHFGLRHIHALNRFPLRKSREQSETADDDNSSSSSKAPSDVDNTVRIMMYMFPRQFGLHNVFTSHVDTSKTAQKLQDYTLREEEIFTRFQKTTDGNGKPHLDVRVPKRLRGRLEHLIQRLQAFHARCSYAQLLQHYCPVVHIAPEFSSHCHSGSARAAVTATNKLPGKNSRGEKKSRQSQLGGTLSANNCSSLTELAVPVAHVSAFCQAVLSKIIPHDFWGHADVQRHNRQTFLRNVDHFIKLRRFETISLHDVTQGVKIAEIEWLAPPGLQSQKCSRTDFRKRSEIFHEFVYYIFDSLLIPLIRSNFYVTESNVHRYRLFFFRHDVWRSISEPAMAELKAKMFEEVKSDEALSILDSRRLGYSHVRLLPKQNTVRPIINLRRRMATKKDRRSLGQSINSVLGPVYNMLRLEKTLDAGRLGSAMFSVGDIYDRISNFKQRVGSSKGPFFFAKVDVQGAFDTIPQAAVVALMNSVPSQAYYEIIKHIEIQPNDTSTFANSTVLKRWHSSAKAARDSSTFLEMIGQQTALGKKNTVFVDSVFRKTHNTGDLLALMVSHIQQNIVKIGKKYYRQRNGIPQGSIISSMLCNYFYADLERTQLQFLQADDCLLLRLIDDFLLITTDKTKAARFVTVMQRGVPEYGVTVSPPKTLVNFTMLSKIDGAPVPTTKTIIPTTDCQKDRRDSDSATFFFPYCSTQINTRTLEITKDRSCATTNVRRDPTLANALTVVRTRRPGANFTRKVLNAFKLQAHLMFFDTRHNATRTVLQNLRDALVETAAKAWAYARCLGPSSSSTASSLSSSRMSKKKTAAGCGFWAPPSSLWTRTVNELVELAYRLMVTSRARRTKYAGYECRVTRAQVRWLALGAFHEVLGRKQAGFGEVLAWLDREMGRMETEKTRRGGGGAGGLRELARLR